MCENYAQLSHPGINTSTDDYLWGSAIACTFYRRKKWAFQKTLVCTGLYQWPVSFNYRILELSPWKIGKCIDQFRVYKIKYNKFLFGSSINGVFRFMGYLRGCLSQT